jgi:hypothetical protein
MWELVGFIAAYGSFAPATANLYADSMIVCYADTATSILAGFTVFSMMGYYAQEQTKIFAKNGPLRTNFCAQDIANGAGLCDSMTGCGPCEASGWESVGACCGFSGVQDVVSSQSKFNMAFLVRTSAASLSE